MKFTRISNYTGKENTMDLPLTALQVNDWLEGEQTAFELFPHLSETEMDFLITGMTPAEHEEIRTELIAEGEIEDVERMEAEAAYA